MRGWRSNFFVTRTGVRFHEKDVERSGKDVRIWQITQHPAGQFFATPVPTC
jgi:hypothetical protein